MILRILKNTVPIYILLSNGLAIASPQTLQLVDFAQVTPTTINFKFNRPLIEPFFLVLKQVPAILQQSEEKSFLRLVDNTEKRVASVKLDEKGLDIYSLVLIEGVIGCRQRLSAKSQVTLIDVFKSCNGVHFLEVVRKTSSWSLNNFGFSNPNGSTILGRRSLSIIAAEPEQPDSYNMVGTPKTVFNLGAENIVTNGSLPEEVAAAIKILAFIWNVEFRTGPAKVNFDEFIQLPFETKLERVRTGDFAIMCEGALGTFSYMAHWLSQI